MVDPVGASAGTSFALPGFRIGEVLGQGGAGTVYAATRADDGTAVAIKVLRADLALTESEVRRFLAEVAMLERIDHPSIVTVLASGRLDDGRPYLVMPGLVGETLAARLRRGRMSIAEALACFDQLAAAVATLHAAGIIHRDLKPENVFLVDGTRVVLLDFGIAKDSDAAPSTTTAEGRIRGTPAYMAPERFFGAAASTRSDVYELAVCLYEMLAGALPWSDPEDVGARLDPPRGDLPAAVWSVVRQALASTLEQRPAITELRDAIAAAAAASTSGSGDAAPRETEALAPAPRPVGAIAVTERETIARSRRRVIAAAAAILAIAVVGVAAVVLAVSSDAPPRAAGDPAAGAGTTVRGGCARMTPRPHFCADFDASGDFRTGFVNAGTSPDPGQIGGGTIRASTTARSGSASAELAIPALAAATDNASAVLFAELGAPVRHATVTMSLRIDTEEFLDPKAVAQLVSLNFGKAGAINLSRKQAGTQLTIYEGNSIVDKVLLKPQLTVGSWKTVKLLIRNHPDEADGRGNVSVMIDGLAAKLPLPVALQGADIHPRLSIGVVAARGPMAPFRVNLDDVAVVLYDGPPALDEPPR